jgi:hypothetical protein
MKQAQEGQTGELMGGHLIALEISSKQELILHCLKLDIVQ